MWILIIGLIVLTAIAMAVGYARNKKIQKKIESGELQAAPEIVEADAECCGQHEICEKESLLAAVSKKVEYYDDEELDRFRGHSSDGYSEEEIEVETIIENRLVTDNSRFTVHGNEESEGYIIKGAYLDGSHDVGYCFPEEQEVNIFREIRSGDWNNMSIKSCLLYTSPSPRDRG